MTVRSDTTIWLDSEPPLVRAQKMNDDPDGPRALVTIAHMLTLYGPIDTLRAALTDALEQLDAITGGAE